ncbi:helix-turn-helix transcriptional regulator [Eggerthellaceae bacterium 24-137]
MNGEKLRGLRESKGLTRRQVEDATGISQGTLWRIERRGVENPNFKTLSALAEFYEVPIDEIIGKED